MVGAVTPEGARAGGSKVWTCHGNNGQHVQAEWLINICDMVVVVVAAVVVAVVAMMTLVLTLVLMVTVTMIVILMLMLTFLEVICPCQPSDLLEAFNLCELRIQYA